MATGHVYILINDSMPGLLKIGKTTDTPEERAKQLSSTGVPFPFKVAYSEEVYDCDRAEQLIHARLVRYRPNKRREFFELPLEEAIAELRKIAEMLRRPARPIDPIRVVTDILGGRPRRSPDRSPEPSRSYSTPSSPSTSLTAATGLVALAMVVSCCGGMCLLGLFVDKRKDRVEATAVISSTAKTSKENAKENGAMDAGKRRQPQQFFPAERQDKQPVPEAQTKLDWLAIPGITRQNSREVNDRLDRLEDQIVEVTGRVSTIMQYRHLRLRNGELSQARRDGPPGPPGFPGFTGGLGTGVLSFLNVSLVYEGEGRPLRQGQVVVVVGMFRSNVRGGRQLDDARVKKVMSEDEYRREADARAMADKRSRPETEKSAEQKGTEPAKGKPGRPAPPDATAKLDWNDVPLVNALNKNTVYAALSKFDGKLVEVTGWVYVIRRGLWSLRNLDRGGQSRPLLEVGGDSILSVIMTYLDEKQLVEAGQAVVVVGDFRESTSDRDLRSGVRRFELVNARMKRVVSGDDYIREREVRLREEASRMRAGKRKPGGDAKEKGEGGKRPPSTKAAKDEAKAKENLDYAQKLIDERQPEKAKSRLEQIVKYYPGTPSAEEAKRLLKKLFP